MLYPLKKPHINLWIEHATAKILEMDPSLKKRKIRRHLSNYYHAVLHELLFSEYPSIFIDRNIQSLELQNLDSRFRPTINKKKTDIHLLNQKEGFPKLYSIVDRGDNIRKTVSKVRFHYDLNYIDSCEYRCWRAQNSQGENYWITLCDQENILRKLIKLRRSYRECKNPILLDAIASDYDELRHFWKLTSRHNGVLNQLYFEHEWGRQYLVGKNLQTAKRHIRHTVLGDCYDIDLNAAVYSFFLWANENHQFNCDTRAINTYRRKKTLIRHLVTRHLIESVEIERKLDLDSTLKMVKQAFTAISFGGKLTYQGGMPIAKNQKGQWKAVSSIAEELGSDPTLYKAFRDIPFVRNLDSELKEIRIKLLELYEKDPLHAEKSIESLYDGKGNLKSASVSAYYYQQHERCLLDIMCMSLETHNVLLKVHDGVYVREYVSSEKIFELNSLIQAINPYASISVEKILG